MYRCQYMNVINADYNSIEITTSHGGGLLALNVNELLTSLVPTTDIKPKKQNVRKELLNQLYDIYFTHANKELRIRNKKRYYAYVRLHHPTALSKESEYNSYKDMFRTAKLPDHQKYLKPIEKDDYRWWGRFSHLKGEEGNEALRHILSVAKDKEHRKEQVIPYILGCIK